MKSLKSKAEIQRQLCNVGYQLEMELPTGKGDWFVAVTNNPDVEYAIKVFVELAHTWRKLVGIPPEADSHYEP